MPCRCITKTTPQPATSTPRSASACPSWPGAPSRRPRLCSARMASSTSAATQCSISSKRRPTAWSRRVGSARRADAMSPGARWRAEPSGMLLRVRSITYLAQRINGYELVDPDECDLPGFTAGAHVSVRVGDGPVRGFSLHNDPAERARYCIAVLREPEGQGSREWHEPLPVGTLVE